MWKPSADVVQIIGLGLNVLAVAVVFLVAYPPTTERWPSQDHPVRAPILFCGFVLQFIAAYQR